MGLSWWASDLAARLVMARSGAVEPDGNEDYCGCVDPAVVCGYCIQHGEAPVDPFYGDPGVLARLFEAAKADGFRPETFRLTLQPLDWNWRSERFNTIPTPWIASFGTPDCCSFCSGQYEVGQGATVAEAVAALLGRFEWKAAEAAVKAAEKARLEKATIEASERAEFARLQAKYGAKV